MLHSQAMDFLLIWLYFKYFCDFLDEVFFVWALSCLDIAQTKRNFINMQVDL